MGTTIAPRVKKTNTSKGPVKTMTKPVFVMGKLMIQKGKAHTIEYFNLCLEFRNYAFSGSVKTSYIRKLTYKEKTRTTYILQFKSDENKFIKFTFIVIYL